MTGFGHKQIVKHLQEIDTPPTGEKEFSKWVQAEKQLNFLINNVNTEDIVIFASPEYSYIYSMAVPEELLEPLDEDDLMGWSANPFNTACAGYSWGSQGDDIWISHSNSTHGSKILSEATQLVYHRSFEGYIGDDKDYFELSQEYAHLAEVHWYPTKNAYCKLDENGDVIPIVSITKRNRKNNINLATFQREALEDYLAASNQALVRMFDFLLLERGGHSTWDGAEEKKYKDSDTFLFTQKACKDKAFTRGVQIIRPKRPKKEIFSDMQAQWSGNKKKKHVELWIHDWRNERITQVSTAPGATINYFQDKDNDLPYELSAAFFNPEVLSKYKADKEKYKVGGDNIQCRGAWFLQSIGLNDAGQIFAYICYLRDLPEKELLHWLSHNEKPKTGISERAYVNHFLGEFYDVDEPLEELKEICRQWDANKVPWWSLKSKKLIDNVTLPLTDNQDEWGNSFKELANLVIEGFNKQFITKKLDEGGIDYGNQYGTLVLMEKIIIHERNEGANFKFSALRHANVIRNKSSHPEIDELNGLLETALLEHETHKEHFEHTCSAIRKELMEIENLFSSLE